MEDRYEIIEKYVNGELSAQELAAFEEKLKTDPDLASEVQLFRQAKESLTDHFQHEGEEIALKETLAEVSMPYFKEEKKPVKALSLTRRYWWIAAGAAAAILVLLVFQPWQGSLYDQYGQFPMAAFTEQGATEGAELSEAQQAFNQGDYSIALEIFNAYLEQESNKDDIEIQFYSGLCHLALESYTQAETSFQAIHAGSSAYKNEGTWFLAITSLKQKEWERTRELLLQIPEESSRRSEAQRLLRKIAGKK